MRRTMVLFLPAVVIASSPAAAQEWTRFRGPNGTGISPARGIPVSWTEKDFLWRVPVRGTGHSQPVVWEDRIFLTSALDEGRERLLICLDRRDGRELWVGKVPLETHPKHRFNGYASGSAVVGREGVFAAWATPRKYLVKAWTHEGKELWELDLGPFDSEHGHGSSPILHEGRLIVPNDQIQDGFLIALEARTGRTVWKCPRRGCPKASFGTPCVLEIPEAAPQILTTSMAHGISGVEARTGTLLWEARVFDRRTVSSPVVAGNLVIGTCGEGGTGSLSAVRLGGKGDVTATHLAYRIDKAAPYVPTPLVWEGRMYLMSDKGIASAVEASTGKVLWTGRVGGNFFGSYVLAEGRLYILSWEGECVVLEAGDRFRILARNPVGEGSYCTPCVAGGRLYLRTFTHLICIGGA